MNIFFRECLRYTEKLNPEKCVSFSAVLRSISICQLWNLVAAYIYILDRWIYYEIIANFGGLCKV